MSITDDIKRVISNKSRGTGRLGAAQEREAIPQAKASEYPSPRESIGGGIASPVTENKISAGGGTYEPSRFYIKDEVTPANDKIFLLTSSDGLYTFEYKLLQQIQMSDANGEDVTFAYQEVDPDTGAAYDD